MENTENLERTVPISKVRNWKDNPKNIKIKDLERLKNQIIELSKFVPGGKDFLRMYKPLIAFPENGEWIVLGGNQRLEAARALGMKDVQIRPVLPKTEADKLAIALSDNDRAGEYDDQSLAELAYREKDKLDLDLFKIDLGPTVTMETLLNAFGPKIESGEEDAVPEQEVPVKSQLGDLFQIGPHRLLCGDATKPWAYTALLQDEKADMVFSDPPPNTAYETDHLGPIKNDNMTEEKFIEFTQSFIDRMKEHTKRGGSFYICSGYSSYPVFLFCIKTAGLTFSGPIIWVKKGTTFGFRDYKSRHEMILKARKQKKTATPIIYGWNGGSHYFSDVKNEADVWEMAGRGNQNRIHPTQKPLGLIQRAIRNSSKPGEIILDPFGGSGSTLIAAEREGRTARIMDLDPKFIDTIIHRYTALGGLTEEEIRATRKTVEREDKE